MDVGGGLVLHNLINLDEVGSSFSEVFEVRLRLEAEFGRYRLYAVPRFADKPVRSYMAGTSWIEEAYIATDLGPVTVKTGKVYAHLGLFYDGSWLGPVHLYDGLKLDPSHGVSFEGNIEGQPFGLGFWAQGFLTDGTSSYADPDRDTHTIRLPGTDPSRAPDAHRRHMVFGRVEPRLKLNEEANIGLTLGGGVSNFEADLPEIVADPADPAVVARPASDDRVTRVAADATFTATSLSIWGEYSRQWGRHVLDWPDTGTSSDDVRYLMFGGEYTLEPIGADWLTLRFTYSTGDYAEVGYKAMRMAPGFNVAMHKYLLLQVEYGMVRGEWDDPAQEDSEFDALFFVFHSNF